MEEQVPEHGARRDGDAHRGGEDRAEYTHARQIAAREHGEQQGDNHRQRNGQQQIEECVAEVLQVFRIGEQRDIVLNVDELRQRAGVGGGEKAGNQRFYERIERKDEEDQHRGKQINDPQRQTFFLHSRGFFHDVDVGVYVFHGVILLRPTA